MSTNMDVLRGKMTERRITQEEMARKIGVNVSTFYRKMKTDGINFTVGQMHKIVEVLKLTNEEAAAIFCGRTRIIARKNDRGGKYRWRGPKRLHSAMLLRINSMH